MQVKHGQWVSVEEGADHWSVATDENRAGDCDMTATANRVTHRLKSLDLRQVKVHFEPSTERSEAFSLTLEKRKPQPAEVRVTTRTLTVHHDDAKGADKTFDEISRQLNEAEAEQLGRELASASGVGSADREQKRNDRRVRWNPFADPIVETAREVGLLPPAAPGDTMLAFVRWLGISDGSRSEVFEAMVADLRYELTEAVTARGKRGIQLRYGWCFACTLVAFGWSWLVKRLRGMVRLG